jgi:hypothetical protein
VAETVTRLPIPERLDLVPTSLILIQLRFSVERSAAVAAAALMQLTAMSITPSLL